MCGTTVTTEWSKFFSENYDLTIHQCMARRDLGEILRELFQWDAVIAASPFDPTEMDDPTVV